jgi:hypothetical protein
VPELIVVVPPIATPVPAQLLSAVTILCVFIVLVTELQGVPPFELNEIVISLVPFSVSEVLLKVGVCTLNPLYPEKELVPDKETPLLPDENFIDILLLVETGDLIVIVGAEIVIVLDAELEPLQIANEPVLVTLAPGSKLKVALYQVDIPIEVPVGKAVILRLILAKSFVAD